MILELDAGNTRIKWRLVGGDQIVTGGAFAADKPGNAVQALVEELDRQQTGALERIRVSSVRGADFSTAFGAMARETWNMEAEFAKVSARAAGVTNAYEDIGAMGVDRWMALLAAYNRAEGGCCVIDYGSAITFDWVNSSGVHQGGYIVPGVSLMQQSLASKTRALDIHLPEPFRLEPGKSTGEAIGNGMFTMVCGFATLCHQQVARAGDDARWFLTGGDAVMLGEVLPWEHEVVSDLVLDGLCYALP